MALYQVNIFDGTGIVVVENMCKRMLNDGVHKGKSCEEPHVKIDTVLHLEEIIDLLKKQGLVDFEVVEVA